jgi:predicted metal-dependent hydrolase
LSFEKGVGEFNEGLFFECHETLEELWSGIRGPTRDFYQGLIQVAVGFYHLGNDNRVGAERLLGRALGRLEAYPDHYGGIDIGELRGEVTGWLLALNRASEGESSPRPLPRIVAVSSSVAEPARGSTDA